MRRIGKILGWAWAVLFLSFFAATLFKFSGNSLPEPFDGYRDAFEIALIAFLNSWMFFVVLFGGWFFVSYRLGKDSGWRRLADTYGNTREMSRPDFFSGSGTIGNVSYANCLRIGGHPSGLALRVIFPLRFGSPNLFIPWSDIRSIELTRSMSTGKWHGIIDTWASKLSGRKYARIDLARFPEQQLVVTWNEKLRTVLPASLKPLEMEAADGETGLSGRD